MRHILKKMDGVEDDLKDVANVGKYHCSYAKAAAATP